MIIPAAALAILVLPAFWLVAHHPTPTTLYAASILLACLLDLSTGRMLVAVAEGPPRARRAGGFALIYAVAISAFGGSTQFAVAGLIRLTGNPLTPAWYMLAALVVGLVAMWRFPRPDQSSPHLKVAGVSQRGRLAPKGTGSGRIRVRADDQYCSPTAIFDDGAA